MAAAEDFPDDMEHDVNAPNAQEPSKIDLLELDIDLRLADLWREASGMENWTLDTAAAFMRAAYGKGYCDSMTDPTPGQLIADHGYRMPQRGQPQTAQ